MSELFHDIPRAVPGPRPMWFQTIDNPRTLGWEIWVRDVQPEFRMHDELLAQLVVHQVLQPESPEACAICAFVHTTPTEEPSWPWVGLILRLTNPDGQSWTWGAIEPTEEDFRLNLVRFRWPD